MSIVCSIIDSSYKIEAEIYNVKTEKSNHLKFKKKSIHQVINELITKYKNNIGIILVTASSFLVKKNKEYFNKNKFKKYGDLVRFVTTEELNFDHYLTLKVKYFVGDLVLMFGNYDIILLQCVNIVKEIVTLREVERRFGGLHKNTDFESIIRMFSLTMNQVHVVFKYKKEKVDSKVGPKLYEYGFKSINFMQEQFHQELLLARFLLPDPTVSVLVKIYLSYTETYSYKDSVIKDWGFIHIPKLVKDYQPRTDIMGIDLGSTRCVLAVSRNKEIQVIPFDSSSPGDLWTESVVSFDEDKPLIGKAAIRRLKTKPDYVIFDAKLLCSYHHRWKRSENIVWPFKFTIDGEQLYFESMTSKGWKAFSLAEINATFLKQMMETANEYQDGFNDGKLVKKAVITVPKYFQSFFHISHMVFSAAQAAKLAGIEVIDIIEETHADLLYYLSNDRYSEVIKPNMKIAILDIGGGNFISKSYKISENHGKRYATCYRDMSMINDGDDEYSGRDIDDIIMKELQKSIPKNLQSKVKLRMLEAAKKIKHDLSFEDKIEFDLSEIHPLLDKMVEFTRAWFEGKLRIHFQYLSSYYRKLKQYPLPDQRKSRWKQEEKWRTRFPPLNDDIVFLAGGTCRIPFIEQLVRKQFPKAKIIKDGELEIITATGAAIHALQVLSGEVEPYVELPSNRYLKDKLDSKTSKKDDTEDSCQIM